MEMFLPLVYNCKIKSTKVFPIGNWLLIIFVKFTSTSQVSFLPNFKFLSWSVEVLHKIDKYQEFLFCGFRDKGESMGMGTISYVLDIAN